MKVIGLSGGSGSGKGYVSMIFGTRGIVSLDTDAIYRELTSAPGECMSELAAEFGEGIVDHSGALNRVVMRELVFSGDRAESNRARLNEISHRHVLSEVRRRISTLRKSGVPAVLVDAPLLFESGFDKECDAVICVTAPTDVRVNRIMSRDGISRESAISRISAQISDEELTARSDYVIKNDGNIDITPEVYRICDLILEK